MPELLPIAKNFLQVGETADIPGSIAPFKLRLRLGRRVSRQQKQENPRADYATYSSAIALLPAMCVCVSAFNAIWRRPEMRGEKASFQLAPFGAS